MFDLVLFAVAVLTPLAFMNRLFAGMTASAGDLQASAPHDRLRPFAATRHRAARRERHHQPNEEHGRNKPDTGPSVATGSHTTGSDRP
jgi:hypothetical protein